MLALNNIVGALFDNQQYKANKGKIAQWGLSCASLTTANPCRIFGFGQIDDTWNQIIYAVETTKRFFPNTTAGPNSTTIDVNNVANAEGIQTYPDFMIG